MMKRTMKRNEGVYSAFGKRNRHKPLVLIAGPCVIESYKICGAVARELVRVGKELKITVVFKASFDKANRTSSGAYRGPGMDEGLKILSNVKKEYGLPVLTDIHESGQAEAVAEIADILQIPAFLSRQTDLLTAAARTKKPVNIKKAQFMAPDDVTHAIQKVKKAGNKKVLVTERGVCFGYNRLVTDVCAFPVLRSNNVPVVFDATHSVQLPGGSGSSSGGRPEFVHTLVSASVAAGIDGLFLEVHPNPPKALSDSTTSLPLKKLFPLVQNAVQLDRFIKKTANNNR